MLHKIMIAGVSSGTGKTTITMGLIAALRRRGLRVQPFKAGPDYIDPTYHSLAAGRPCRNIDTWMVPPKRALSLFHKATHETDVAVIEGVMGLFDGFSYTDEAGSSAHIAKLVSAPVLLVLDVGKMARSAGALALGYTQFDPELNIVGFILNRCGSQRHYEGVKLAIEQTTARPVVGWLPKDAELHIPARHLGLVPTDERGELTTFINHAATLIEQYFDLDHLLTLTQPLAETFNNQLPITKYHAQNPREASISQAPTKIAVARDAAFSFYYEDNLDLLRESGAEILFFSPLADVKLPPGVSGLYLGGGFPEMYAAQLAQNPPLYESIRQANSAKMPIYSECGGFMYLSEAIIDLDGQEHPMIGLVPGLTRMQPRLMSLGYRVVESYTGNFLLPAHTPTRGHEFHWSSWEQPAIANNQLPREATNYQPTTPAWHIQSRQANGDPQTTGYATENLIASYIHLHFAYEPQLTHNFVRACQQWKTMGKTDAE
jgi:cobyrinic acid a,c-diamide synthase